MCLSGQNTSFALFVTISWFVEACMIIVCERKDIMERLKKQMEFLAEIDKLKTVTRQSYLCDASRKEGDAEHSWHLAMFCLVLSEYANDQIDVLRVMAMVLIHDIVEIDAGDTYAYDTEGGKTQRQREEKAADRLFGLLPQEQGEDFRELWEEFEERKTMEAKFARTLDCMQPIMLNACSDGKAWKEHEVALSQIMGRNQRTKDGSQVLWEYAFSEYIKPNVDKGRIRRDIEE